MSSSCFMSCCSYESSLLRHRLNCSTCLLLDHYPLVCWSYIIILAVPIRISPASIHMCRSHVALTRGVVEGSLPHDTKLPPFTPPPPCRLSLPSSPPRSHSPRPPELLPLSLSCLLFPPYRPPARRLRPLHLSCRVTPEACRPHVGSTHTTCGRGS